MGSINFVIKVLLLATIFVSVPVIFAIDLVKSTLTGGHFFEKRYKPRLGEALVQMTLFFGVMILRSNMPPDVLSLWGAIVWYQFVVYAIFFKAIAELPSPYEYACDIHYALFALMTGLLALFIYPGLPRSQEASLGLGLILFELVVAAASLALTFYRAREEVEEDKIGQGIVLLIIFYLVAGMVR